MSNWEQYLHDIYFNPTNPASFSGPDKLYRYTQKEGKYDISYSNIRQWLQQQEPFSLQKPVFRSFKKNKIIVTGIDDQWSADLMDMVKFKEFNKGYTYILIVIDVFSKYLWIRPLKTKQGKEVGKSLGSILREGRSPNRIRTDKGSEFKSKEVKKILEKHHIQHLYAQNETKAAIAERVIKTIKSKLYRYFTFKRDYTYIDRLQDFVNSYNTTYHRSIGMAPNQVTKDNETIVWWRLYWPNTLLKKQPFRFNVGDHVRITYLKTIFTREYDDKWTGEVFTISERKHRGALPIYRLKDYNRDEIQGTFYQSELQKIDVNDNDLWKVEKILKSKGKGRNKQYFVKWLYWPKKFNSWINASDLTNI